MTGEFENDVYTVRIRLNYLIPEFLPIRGKRARVYYHGIAPFCILCYTPGHHRQECGNNPVTWSEYIESLKDTGIPAPLFEPLESSFHFNSFNSNNSNSNLTSTPRGQNNQLNQLRELLQEALFQNNSQANPGPSQAPPQAPPAPPQVNPIPRMVTRRSAGSESAVADPQPPPRGRGRSRNRGGQQQPQFQNLFSLNNSANQNNQPIGRGRGRGLNRVNLPDVPLIVPDHFYPEAQRPRGRGAQYSFWGHKRP
jgi:hypothetical protein